MLEYTKYIKDLNKLPKQLVVMLHGYGSNKDDLINLAPELSRYLPDALFLSPSAPFQFEGTAQKKSRQWFSLFDRSKNILLKELKIVEKIILDFIITHLKENYLNKNNLCLLGFSQGTMLSLYLVLEYLIKPNLLLGYSGEIMNNKWACGVDKKNTKVMLIHGQEDNIIPIGQMQLTNKILNKYGFQTQNHILKYLGHSIDSSGINKGGNFLQNNF